MHRKGLRDKDVSLFRDKSVCLICILIWMRSKRYFDERLKGSNFRPLRERIRRACAVENIWIKLMRHSGKKKKKPWDKQGRHAEAYKDTEWRMKSHQSQKRHYSLSWTKTYSCTSSLQVTVYAWGVATNESSLRKNFLVKIQYINPFDFVENVLRI